jgi:hypothetical protein
MRVATAVPALTASAVLALLAGCGSSDSLSVGERQYAANAAGLIDQLHGDLIASSAAVGEIGDARRLLGRTSDLYVLLMTFDDFDGCSTMLRNVGDPGRRFSRVHATLASACHDLEGGSRLFTTAANGSDPAALLAAQDTSRLASPLLYRAELELNAAKRHRR